jgi:hypothetical protein
LNLIGKLPGLSWHHSVCHWFCGQFHGSKNN